MNKLLGLVLGLLSVALVVLVESSPDHHWANSERVGGACDGPGGTCEADENATTRRSLIQPGQRYISYDVLKKNRVPCGQRGASYYSCSGKSKRANPYNRGCSAITHCYRYTS